MQPDVNNRPNVALVMDGLEQNPIHARGRHLERIRCRNDVLNIKHIARSPADALTVLDRDALFYPLDKNPQARVSALSGKLDAPEFASEPFDYRREQNLDVAL